MKKVILGILIIFQILFCFIFVMAEDKDLKQWNYSKNINNIDGNNKYKEVILDKEVYKYAKQDLSDLRVIDDNGKTVPYYLQNSYLNIVSENTVYNSVKTNEFNKEKDLFVDFKITPIKENIDIMGNRLIFTIAQKKFLKNIEISGSFDGNEWQYITTGSIYMVDNLSKTEVLLNGNLKYGYYRIKIPNNLESVQITTLQLGYEQSVKTEESFEMNDTLAYDLDNTDNTTLINLKNSNRLKIKQIHLDIAGNFNRHYLVLLKSADGFSPTQINGDIYNLHFSDLDISNTDIDFKNNSFSSELIQLKIMNLDDKPLDIKSISVKYFTDKLIFEGAGGSRYSLLFGNSQAVRPYYDLEKYKEHIDKESRDVGTLGALQTLAKPVAKKEEADTVIIFNIVIVIVAVGLIFLIVIRLNFKKAE